MHELDFPPQSVLSVADNDHAETSPAATMTSGLSHDGRRILVSSGGFR